MFHVPRRGLLALTVFALVVVFVQPASAISLDVEPKNVASVDADFKVLVEQGSVVIHKTDGSLTEVPCSMDEKNGVIDCSGEDGEGLIGVLNVDEMEGIKSASGTNKDVKIVVVGSKLVVDSWQTRARQYPWDGCIGHDALFWGRNPGQPMMSLIWFLDYLGPCVEVPSGYASIDWWTTGNGPAGEYLDGTVLCNTWAPTSKLSGQPCITVHD